MAYRRKNKNGGKIVLGIASAVLITGSAAGAMYALDQAQVSAKDEVKEETKEENKVSETTSIKELEEKVAELEASKKDLQAKITTLGSEKETLEAEVSDLEETIADNQASITSLTAQITSLDEQIIGLIDEKAILEENAEANENRIAELLADIETLDREKAAIQADLDAREETINNLNTQISSLNEEITNLNAQIEELNQGQYTLTIDNTEMIISSIDYYNIANYTSDIHSTLSGVDVSYQVIAGPMTNEVVDGIITEKASIFYFNGTPDNGAYAIRNVTIDSNKDSYLGYYNNNRIDNHLFMNVGDTFDLSNFDVQKNTYLFDTSATLNHVTITPYNGESISLGSETGITSYALDEETNYHVTASVDNSWVEFTISTKTGNVSNIPYGYTLVSENWDSEGNYVVNLLDVKNESMTVTVKKEYFVDYTDNDHSMWPEYIELSEGNEYLSGSGGLGNVGFNFNDSEGNYLTLEFYEVRIAEMHAYYLENFAE